MAQTLVSDSRFIFSTDNYFVNAVNGQYYFDPKKIKDAHEWNQICVKNHCQNYRNNIVIDNTNTQQWEAAPYIQMAKEYGFQVVFVRPDTEWANDPYECFKRCSHGVPFHVIQSMHKRMEVLTCH